MEKERKGRAYIFDYDGTLTERSGDLDDVVSNMSRIIARILANGNRVCIASSKSLKERADDSGKGLMERAFEKIREAVDEVVSETGGDRDEYLDNLQFDLDRSCSSYYVEEGELVENEMGCIGIMEDTMTDIKEMLSDMLGIDPDKVIEYPGDIKKEQKQTQNWRREGHAVLYRHGNGNVKKIKLKLYGWGPEMYFFEKDAEHKKKVLKSLEKIGLEPEILKSLEEMGDIPVELWNNQKAKKKKRKEIAEDLEGEMKMRNIIGPSFRPGGGEILDGGPTDKNYSAYRLWAEGYRDIVVMADDPEGGDEALFEMKKELEAGKTPKIEVGGREQELENLKLEAIDVKRDPQKTFAAIVGKELEDYRERMIESQIGKENKQEFEEIGFGLH